MNNPNDFLDRQVEIDSFIELIKKRQQRVLLVHGEQGMGKTWLLRRLRRECDQSGIIAAGVDFHLDKTQSEEGEQVICCLEERLGGLFAVHMSQAEAQIQQNFASDAVQTLLSAPSSGSSGDITISGAAWIGGDVIGRDKITNNITLNNSPITINADNKLLRVKAKREIAHNWAFRSALTAFLAQNQVVLFFDHFEEATTVASGWLYEQLLKLHLVDTGKFTNLWIVVAGSRVPLQDEVDQWRDVLRSQRIGPLPEEALYLYWVDQRGVQRTVVDILLKATKRNTLRLFLDLQDYEESLTEEKSCAH